MVVLVSLCEAGSILVDADKTDESTALGIDNKEKASRREEIIKLTLAMGKAARAYLDALPEPSRVKRDDEKELSKCADVSGAVAATLGGITAALPNPVTGFAAAIAGVISGSCAISKHTDYLEDDGYWDPYVQ